MSLAFYLASFLNGESQLWYFTNIPGLLHHSKIKTKQTKRKCSLVKVVLISALLNTPV